MHDKSTCIIAYMYAVFKESRTLTCYYFCLATFFYKFIQLYEKYFKKTVKRLSLQNIFFYSPKMEHINFPILETNSAVEPKLFGIIDTILIILYYFTFWTILLLNLQIINDCSRTDTGLQTAGTDTGRCCWEIWQVLHSWTMWT